MSNSRSQQVPSALSERQRRKRRERWIVAGVLFGFAVVLLVAGRDLFFGGDPRPDPGGEARRASPPRSSDEAEIAAGPSSQEHAAVTPELVEDDGRTLWASPTAGKPIDLAFLPPGVQLMLAARPAALAAHPEGEKVLAALGPLGQRGIRFVEEATGLEWPDIEHLVIGWQADSTGEWRYTLVATPTNPIQVDVLQSRFAAATPQTHSRRHYWTAGERAYWLPEAEGPRQRLVVSSPGLIQEIIDLAGQAPPLRREVERLLVATDTDRHATLLLAPNFLFSEGAGMFAGPMVRLRAPLYWFLGDGLSAAALSLHWDDNFFLELVATPTLDLSPARAAGQIATRLAEVPERLEEYVLALEPRPYGRRVVARLPEMLRKLIHYSRRGTADGHALVRGYMPAVAGHNLLMAAELTLAQPPGGAQVALTLGDEPVSPGPPPAAGAEQKLQQITSLRFNRDTLEAALDLLAEDVGVDITILGADLQLEGITKNQSFGIDLEDRPAAEILVEILRQANPDKLASGPSDPRQKLVYIIRSSPGRPEAILVTTRARAMERGDSLPPVFVEPPR